MLSAMTFLAVVHAEDKLISGVNKLDQERCLDLLTNQHIVKLIWQFE